MNPEVIGAWIGALVVGFICGTITLIIGKKKKRSDLGIIGFFACIISGLLRGLLFAGPVALFFILIIFTIKKPDHQDNITKPSQGKSV